MQREKVQTIENFLTEGRKLFAQTSMIEWLVQNVKVKTAQGYKPFSFAGHEPLREIYQQDEHPRLTFRKAAQLGVSTFSSLRSLYLGQKKGVSTAYYFPTDEDVDDFVQDKFEPIVQNSETLSQMKRHDLADNKGLKQFGRFSVYFRGVFSKRKVKSITVDQIIKDELDEANQENMRFAEDRVLHSDFGYVVELSQPSIDDYAIDKSFKESDMSFYGFRCEHCGTWNFPDKHFPDCLITRGSNVYVGCVKCSKKLTLSGGEWVAEHPARSKDHRGFQLSHLVFTLLPAKKIKERYENAVSLIDKKNFYISILGLPFSTPNSRPLTREVLRAAERDFGLMPSARFSFFGMDVGDKCHLVFGHVSDSDSGTIQIHYMCEMPADDVGAIVRLMKGQGVYSGVIDAMPYKTFAKQIAREFGGRVYINYYKGDTMKTGSEGEGSFVVPKVTVNRDESLDETIETLRDGRIVLPTAKKMEANQAQTYEDFLSQLTMLIKEDVDKGGLTEWHYKKNVPNHYGMALNYMRIAAELSAVHVTTGLNPVFVSQEGMF